MNQQDLVWLKLPFSNLKEGKIRPAVVISNDEYNTKNQDVVVCAITSNLEPKKYSIPISQANLMKGNLPVKSRIRADKLAQVEKTLILKPFAKLDSKTFDNVVNEIHSLIKRN